MMPYMTIRRAFVDSTYGQRLTFEVWKWWLRVENAYKRMWPGEEMLEPPTLANESEQRNPTARRRS